VNPFSGINAANPLQAAQRYIQQGLYPVPAPYKTKAPKIDGWQKLRITGDQASRYFGDQPQNIGVILGENGLGDIDCDTIEAAVAASALALHTGMVFGRVSKRASHLFYFLSNPVALMQFKDPTNKKMLVELRCQKKDGGIGLQTIVPPSVHPEGEKIEFEPGGDGEPALVDAGQLMRCVMYIAAAALLARHWPAKGSRHEAMLALAGALWRAGWSKKAAKKLCRVVYRAVADHDPQAITRSDREVEDSYTRGGAALERGEEAKITGQPTLCKLLGDIVVATAMKWLPPPDADGSAPAAPTAATTVNKGTSQAVEQPVPPVLEAVESGAPAPPATTGYQHPYREENGGIVRSKVTVKASGETVEQTIRLTDFTARITADVGEDDGVEIKRNFEIKAKVGQTSSTFIVAAAHFAQMDWAIPELGPKAIVQPNQKDWARTAIQSLSTDIEKRSIYTHTGWRRDGDSWLYLFNGGAIGASGIVPGVDVRLSGALSRYSMALPADHAALIAAVNASLRVLDTAPDHVTFALLAAVYRAVVKPCDFAVWFAGPTGVFKSELAALAQQHFGPGMDSRHLPANFASTGNALEMLAFHAKEALLVIDDFAPHGGMQDMARYHSSAERIIRSAGNSQGRGRLDSTAKLRDAKAPRGLVVITGEDVPRGQSIRGRTLIVEVGPGDVQTKVLTENQAAAASGFLAQSLAAFVQYIAGDYDRIQREFQQTVLATRSRATTVHSRTPGIVAELQSGFELFLEFAIHVGAITAPKAAHFKERCWKALHGVAKAQRAPQEASEPAHRFLELLRATLAAGKAHVATPGGGAPTEEEGAWGWRWEESGKEGRYVAKGSCIGWVDGPNLYLEPTAAYAVVQDLGRSTGEPLAVSEIALKKRLREKGLLASIDVTRQTLTVRRTLQGANRSVLHLQAAALIDDVGFQPADVGSMSGFSEAPDNESANGANTLEGNVGFVRRDPTGESPANYSRADGRTERVEVEL
jgi:hypothetical protein